MALSSTPAIRPRPSWPRQGQTRILSYEVLAAALRRPRRHDRQARHGRERPVRDRRRARAGLRVAVSPRRQRRADARHLPLLAPGFLRRQSHERVAADRRAAQAGVHDRAGAVAGRCGRGRFAQALPGQGIRGTSFPRRAHVRRSGGRRAAGDSRPDGRGDVCPADRLRERREPAARPRRRARARAGGPRRAGRHALAAAPATAGREPHDFRRRGAPGSPARPVRRGSADPARTAQPASSGHRHDRSRRPRVCRAERHRRGGAVRHAPRRFGRRGRT